MLKNGQKTILITRLSAEFNYADVPQAKAKDYLYVIFVVGLLVLCRMYNMAALFGGIVTGGSL